MAKTWHYSLDGADTQTLDEKAFAEHCRTGRISDATMVWTPGMNGWQSYAELRAADEAAEAVRKASREKSEAAGSKDGVARHTCAKCGKEWPTALMIKAGGKRFCRLCHSQEEEATQAAVEYKALQKETSRMGVRAKLAFFLLAAVAVGAYFYNQPTEAEKSAKSPAKKPAAAVGTASPGSAAGVHKTP